MSQVPPNQGSNVVVMAESPEPNLVLLALWFNLIRWIDMFELTASVLGGEPPVYDGGGIVALAFERRNLCLSNASSPTRRFRHSLNSISAMFNQLP